MHICCRGYFWINSNKKFLNQISDDVGYRNAVILQVHLHHLEKYDFIDKQHIKIEKSQVRSIHKLNLYHTIESAFLVATIKYFEQLKATDLITKEELVNLINKLERQRTDGIGSYQKSFTTYPDDFAYIGFNDDLIKLNKNDKVSKRTSHFLSEDRETGVKHAFYIASNKDLILVPFQIINQKELFGQSSIRYDLSDVSHIVNGLLRNASCAVGRTELSVLIDLLVYRYYPDFESFR